MNNLKPNRFTTITFKSIVFLCNCFIAGVVGWHLKTLDVRAVVVALLLTLLTVGEWESIDNHT